MLISLRCDFNFPAARPSPCWIVLLMIRWTTSSGPYMLWKNLKWLMVYKLVYVEELKRIKQWMHCNGVLDKCRVLMCWQGMNSSIDGIKMNNGEMWITSIICVQFNHPKSCVPIRFEAHMWIPLNQCARIFFVFMPKWKEKEDTHYFKPTNTFNFGIWVDQNSVVVCLAFPPWWCCSDMFTPHAGNATDITQGVKSCNSWVKTWTLPLILGCESCDDDGSLTARMCLDSVIDEQSPFGAPIVEQGCGSV